MPYPRPWSCLRSIMGSVSDFLIPLFFLSYPKNISDNEKLSWAMCAARLDLNY